MRSIVRFTTAFTALGIGTVAGGALPNAPSAHACTPYAFLVVNASAVPHGDLTATGSLVGVGGLYSFDWNNDIAGGSDAWAARLDVSGAWFGGFLYSIGHNDTNTIMGQLPSQRVRGWFTYLSC